MTKAIIYISGDLDPHAADRCLDHVKRKGYEFTGIARDWEEAADMLRHGVADVAVVDSENDLEPNRKPRVEVVANQPSSRYETRTRIIPRGEAR